MITADNHKATCHYGVDETCRTVLAGIFKRIGARVTSGSHASGSHDADPLSIRYIPGIDMLECLRDLKSLLDRSDSAQSVLCLLMEWRVVEEHLAPLLMALRWGKQPEACLLVVRLICLFVNPVVDGLEEWAAERVHHQRILKRHLGSHRFVKHTLSILVDFFRDADKNGMTTEQEEAVKAVMFLVKAVVMIPDADIQNRLGVYGRGEQVFEALYETRMYEFLLCLVGQLESFGFLFTGLVEIFGCLFGAVQDVEHVFSTSASASDGQPYTEEPEMARPVRHSRFAGSVVVQLSTGKELLLKASRQFTSGVDYDLGKRQAWRRRQSDYASQSSINRLPEHLVNVYRQAADEFLNSAFNVLLSHAHRYLEVRMSDRQAPVVCHHVTTLCTFFLLFVERHGHDHGLVAAVTPKLAFTLHRHYRDCLLERDWAGAVHGLTFWRHYIHHHKESDHFDEVARIVFYEYDVLRYPAAVMTAVKNGSVKTAVAMVEAAHVWLAAVEAHTTSRPVMLVGRRKRHGAGDVGDEQQEVDGERIEREFRFTQLLAEFANDNVVECLVLLIKNAPKNDVHVNRHLAKFLNRLHDQLLAHDLLHRVHVISVLHTFVLQQELGWRRVNEHLVAIAKHIGKAFLERLKVEPWLLVTSLLGGRSLLRRSTVEPDGAGTGTEPEYYKLVDNLSTTDRQQDLALMVKAAVSLEYSHHLNWLITALSAQLNLLLAGALSDHDAVLWCDSDRKKRACLDLRQLLEYVGFVFVDGKFRLPLEVVVERFEQDLNVMVRCKQEAESESALVEVASRMAGTAGTAAGSRMAGGKRQKAVIVSDNTDDIDGGQPESHSESHSQSELGDFDVSGMKRKWEEMRASHHFLRQPLPMVIDSDEEA